MEKSEKRECERCNGYGFVPIDSQDLSNGYDMSHVEECPDDFEPCQHCLALGWYWWHFEDCECELCTVVKRKRRLRAHKLTVLKGGRSA